MRTGKYPVLYILRTPCIFSECAEQVYNTGFKPISQPSVGPPASNHGLSRVFRGRDRPVPNSPRVSHIFKVGICFSQYTVFSYFRIPRDPRDPRVPGFWSPKGTSGRYVSNLSFRKGTRVLMMSVQGSFCQIKSLLLFSLV